MVGAPRPDTRQNLRRLARHSGGSVFVLTNGMTLMLDHREVKHLAICWEQEYEKTIKDFLSKFGDDKDFLSKLGNEMI